jgi:hypothetical protein
MNNYKPYTYLIRFKPTGQLYYGASYANNRDKIANPSQLWVSYFTSSKEIQKLITEYGENAFDVEVRQIFETAEQTLKWENAVLSKFNAKDNPDWLNKQNGDKKFTNNGHSEETRRKISNSNKGQISNRTGLPLTEEHKKKIAASNKGKTFTEEHKLNLSVASKNRRHSIETKQKMAEIRKGKTLSEETKQKISNAHKGRKCSPKSEENKRKISEQLKKYWAHRKEIEATKSTN